MKRKKLHISRETLRALDRGLEEVRGGVQHIANTEDCPMDPDTSGGPTTWGTIDLTSYSC